MHSDKKFSKGSKIDNRWYLMQEVKANSFSKLNAQEE